MQLLADGQISDISQQVIVAYIYIYIYTATPQFFKGNTLVLMIVCRVRL